MIGVGDTRVELLLNRLTISLAQLMDSYSKAGSDVMLECIRDEIVPLHNLITKLKAFVKSKDFQENVWNESDLKFIIDWLVECRHEQMARR